MLANGNAARKDIEYDPNTACPLAYHLLDYHPGDYLAMGRRVTSQRIPASEICHVWDRRRIKQHSGISWMAAVVLEAYRMEDCRHIVQDGARIQNTFAGFLKSAFPGFQLGTGLTGFKEMTENKHFLAALVLATLNHEGRVQCR